MPEWIGRDLKRLRKLRGLRREDLAAQLPEPVSPSTIRNIEHDETYNVSVDLLRQIAWVLGAELRITCEAADLPALSAEAGEGDRRVIDNDYFIRYIRERHPACPLSNSQIGRRMWDFARPRGAELVKGRKQLKREPETFSTVSHRLPTTAAVYAIREADLEKLHGFADQLGRAFRDGKGRVLVPLS